MLEKNHISYWLTVLLVGAAAVLRYAVGQAFGVTAPCVTFYPAVVFSALVGGVGPGLLATGLSFSIISWFFLPPIGSFYIEGFGDVVTMWIFVFNAVLITFIANHLRAVRIEAESPRRSE